MKPGWRAPAGAGRLWAWRLALGSVARAALGAPRWRVKDPVGRAGEGAAVRFLRAQGHQILGRNVRLRGGEVDIVAQAPDGRTIAIVEVKTRVAGARRRIGPEASVGVRKRRKLIALSRRLIRKHGWRDRPVRIDVVAVEFQPGQAHPESPSAVIRHHPGAVRA